MRSTSGFAFSFSFLSLVAFQGCVATIEEPDTPLASELSESLTLQDHIDVCTADPRVQQGLVPLDVCVGAELFFREPFGGNGRTCGSCHPAANNYTIDKEFIATLPASDPLFVAETVPALANLEMPTLMRDFGLILENVDGLSSPTTRFAMRSVPHCFSLGTSITAQATPTDGTTRPPNERTGWSGDGAPNNGELRDFQTGAIIQHYPKTLGRVEGPDFVLATPAELDKIRAFTGTIGRSNEISLAAIALTDPAANAGLAKFQSADARCNGCHRNAGANTGAGVNLNFNTGVERVRIPDLNAQGIPFDGGFGGGGVPAFNFDANGDSVLDSFGNGTFNTPPLIEAADTGPFFHSNAFNTIEDAVGFYASPAFAGSPAGGGNPANISPTDIANIGRFLRVLNAAFNAQIALKRIDGLIPLIEAGKNKQGAEKIKMDLLQQQLAVLALAEVDDATGVLSGVTALNTSAQTQLNAAHTALVAASTVSSHTQRARAAQDARTAVIAANASLTTTPAALTFVVGPGILMF